MKQSTNYIRNEIDDICNKDNFMVRILLIFIFSMFYFFVKTRYFLYTYC